MGVPRIDTDLVQRLTPVILAALRHYRLSRDDHHDVLQTVWLLLMAHAHTIREPDRVAGWLCTAARREATRLVRHAVREQRHRSRLAERQVAHAPTEEQLLRRDRDRALWTIVARLGRTERRIVALLTQEPDMSARRLAAHLGTSPRTAARARARTLDRLRRELVAEGITGP